MTQVLNLKIDPTLFDYQIESVDGKSVLITGGTIGIGRATAILLASQGARIMIFGRHNQELKDAMKHIREAGGEVLGFTADTADAEDIKHVFQEVDDQQCRIRLQLCDGGAIPGLAIYCEHKHPGLYGDGS